MLRLLTKLFYTCVLLIEGLISFRIILSVLNTNSNSYILKTINKYSDFFIAPFYDIVDEVLKIGGITIDLTVITALVFYIILAFIASEIAKAFSHGG